jgi:hypothetical protein
VGKRHPTFDDGEKPSHCVKQPASRNQKVWPSHLGPFAKPKRALQNAMTVAKIVKIITSRQKDSK